MLSVVIPTANETENLFFQKTVANLKKIKNVELICIDRSEARTRAERLNLGFSRSSGSMILFYHPRSYLDSEGIQFLIDHHQKIFWGAFTHRFDVTHPLLRFTSWYSNHIRGKLSGIFYLDHCLFFHRSLWTTDLPAIEIFEDTILSQNLRRQMKATQLPFNSTTSAIRFTKNGLWTQALMNQVLKLGFHLGVPHDTINKIYERGLNLNSKL